jgi:hypothetical protein
MIAPSIAGAATSIKAFVGPLPQGPQQAPVAISDIADFERSFGPVASAGCWADRFRCFSPMAAPAPMSCARRRVCPAVSPVMATRRARPTSTASMWSKPSTFGQFRFAAELDAASLGAVASFSGARADQIPLELCHLAQDNQHQAAVCRGRVSSNTVSRVAYPADQLRLQGSARWGSQRLNWATALISVVLVSLGVCANCLLPEKYRGLRPIEDGVPIGC